MKFFFLRLEWDFFFKNFDWLKISLFLRFSCSLTHCNPTNHRSVLVQCDLSRKFCHSKWESDNDFSHKIKLFFCNLFQNLLVFFLPLLAWAWKEPNDPVVAPAQYGRWTNAFHGHPNSYDRSSNMNLPMKSPKHLLNE